MPGAVPAIVVLGCRARLEPSVDSPHSQRSPRLIAGALSRRVEMGAETYHARGDARGEPQTIVVVSGGRRWGDVVEADAMALELARRGVPEHAIVRERCSLSTRENARFTALALGRRGIGSAAIVTCEWHMARALALFARAGLEVEGVAARGGPDAPWPSKILRWGLERVLTQV